MSATGRPRTPGQVVAVVDGRAVAWDSGQFAGDPDLVTAAQLHAALQTPTRLHPHGSHHNAGHDTAVGAAAAIIAAGGGRAILTDYPDEVAQAIPHDEPATITIDESR